MPARRRQSISRALADSRRFEILQKIAARPSAACTDLRCAFPISAATLSHHLKELETCGLIGISRRGKFVDVVFQRTVWEAYVAALARL